MINQIKKGKKLMKQKITKNVLVMMTVILLLCTILPSQIVKAKDNEKQFEKIDEFVEKQKENFKIPALAIGIVSGNEVVYQKGFGKADSEGRVVTPQTPFEIGSVSKSFTALAVMQLVDADKIDLDKTIDQYLPWFQATYKGVERKITVQQLLNHSSGIKEFYVSSVPDDSTIDQLVRENLNHMHLNYRPGSKSEYSNANYIILGGIIQEVTGLTFPEYLTKYIYEPLEMKHSYVSKEEALKHNLADGNKKWFGFPVVFIIQPISIILINKPVYMPCIINFSIFMFYVFISITIIRILVHPHLKMNKRVKTMFSYPINIFHSFFIIFMMFFHIKMGVMFIRKNFLLHFSPKSLLINDR